MLNPQDCELQTANDSRHVPTTEHRHTPRSDLNDGGRQGRPLRSASVVLVVLSACAQSAWAQLDHYDHPPINYTTAEVTDPVAELSRRIEAGEVELAFDRGQGYLPSVLQALDVSISSQTLVFSQTSMQRHRISSRRPRALYFNEEVYVGFCQNGDVLELAATDARQGAIFYTLEQTPEDRPRFVRDQGQCLTCHSSSRTQDVPGYLIRSVFAKASGQPEFGSGTFTTDHTSPLEERWGGWYVTGTHGEMRHMGNALFDRQLGDLDRDSHANLTSLVELVSTQPYPSPHSDIVALMVMEHQTQMHNAIAWANYEARRAIHQSEIMNEALGRSEGFLSESSDRRIDQAADRVLRYLLMCDEFPLTSAVEGTSSFREDFEARGLRDSQGRSLRDFDLQTRMFRYPCSYLIHSAAFDGLPDQVRSRVLGRLKAILNGRGDMETYRHLTRDDRSALLQILNATKAEFATTPEEKT